MYRIIFLDVNGVLVPDGQHFWSDGFDKYCASQLNRILTTVRKSKVVISSSWRNIYSLRHIAKLMSEAGIVRNRLIGSTPNLYGSYHRGTEISHWLFNNNCEGFVILEDSKNVYPFENRLVKINPAIGLSKWAADEAIEFLLKDNECDGKLLPRFQEQEEDSRVYYDDEPEDWAGNITNTVGNKSINRRGHRARSI